MSTIFSSPRLRELTSSGTVQSGAKLYFYLTGTSTPATSYTSELMTQPHGNPVEADSGGLFPAIFLDEAVGYDITCTDSADVVQWVVEGYTIGQQGSFDLTSRGTAEPFANVYIRFVEPDNVAKGFIGFPVTTDNRFVVQTREDVRMRLGTGDPADPLQPSIERASVHGTATESWAAIHAPGATGGASLRLVNSDASAVRGTVGFADTANSDLDISNAVTGGNIDFAVVGTGRIRLPLTSGTLAAPMWTIVGDTNTGLYSPAADSLTIVAGGINGLTVTASGGTVVVTVGNPAQPTEVAALAVPDGSSSQPAIHNISDSNTGIYWSAADEMVVATGGNARFVFNSTGSVRFVSLGAAPASPNNGDVYYDSGTNKLRVRAAGAWVDLH
jgi:hypothetical protein